MNIGLAQRAILSLTDAGFETTPGYCLRWVRQVVQAHYGHPVWKVPQGYDAREAMAWLCRDGDAEPHAGMGLIGSVLFYDGPHHGEHGHVVIRIPGNLVAENSIVHHPDGRGTRRIELLGSPSAVWNLPEKSQRTLF